ncbi:MAG: TraR/DksA family transcriptional regulator [Gemmatimonadota bacterium]
MESAFAREQLDEFRRHLLQLRAAITAAVDARLHGPEEDRRHEAGLPQRAAETDDDGAAETARLADLAHLSRNADELDRIDAALARIADGTYGICVDCDEPIAVQRLRAYPAALRCAACQERFERRPSARG